jgi:hypothetical protein
MEFEPTFEEFAQGSATERRAFGLDPLNDSELRASWGLLNNEIAARGEQPDSLALPNAGALRGDVPLSSSNREEAK